jgi:glycosyltransferase involved in cell wall biosynthesis
VEGARLVFVGQMGWFPNRDGVQWFLDEIFPRVLAQRPDAHFVLVGKAQGLRVPQALAPHVQLAGFVDDLRPYIHSAGVYVVPLRSGSGTRLKVLEAMAFGKAIVTTRIGAEGIRLAPGEEALFADDAESFANAVLELIADPVRAQGLGAAARANAQANYDWNAIGKRVVACYEEVLDVTARARASDTPVLRPARGVLLPS